jgi:hypothetical protein
MNAKQRHSVAIKLHTYMMENNINDSEMGHRLGFGYDDNLLVAILAAQDLPQDLERISEVLKISIPELLN